MSADRDKPLFCLGDISVHQDEYALEVFEDIVMQRNAPTILTPGNHDMAHEMFKNKSFNWVNEYSKVFDVVVNGFTLILNSQQVRFQHYPVWNGPACDRSFEKEKTKMYWAPEGFDYYVHGHTHNKIPVRYKTVNVALEAHDMKTVDSEELKKMLKLSKNKTFLKTVKNK